MSLRLDRVWQSFDVLRGLGSRRGKAPAHTVTANRVRIFQLQVDAWRRTTAAFRRATHQFTHPSQDEKRSTPAPSAGGGLPLRLYWPIAGVLWLESDWIDCRACCALSPPSRHAAREYMQGRAFLPRCYEPPNARRRQEYRLYLAGDRIPQDSHLLLARLCPAGGPSVDRVDSALDLLAEFPSGGMYRFISGTGDIGTCVRD